MRASVNRLKLFLPLMLLLLSACAAVKPAPTEDPELRQRAQTYWDLRMARDFADSYLFEDPGFRKNYKLTPYIAELSGGILHTAKVDSVTAEGDRGTIILKVTYNMSDAFMPTGADIARTLIDRWERIDGVWYHLFRPPAPAEPPPSSDGSADRPRPRWRLPSGAEFDPKPETTETQEK